MKPPVRREGPGSAERPWPRSLPAPQQQQGGRLERQILFSFVFPQCLWGWCPASQAIHLRAPETRRRGTAAGSPTEQGCIAVFRFASSHRDGGRHRPGFLGVERPHPWRIPSGERGVKTQRLCACTSPAHLAPAFTCFSARTENSQWEGQRRIRAGPLPRSPAPSHPSSSTRKSTGKAAALPHV